MIIFKHQVDCYDELLMIRLEYENIISKSNRKQPQQLTAILKHLWSGSSEVEFNFLNNKFIIMRVKVYYGKEIHIIDVDNI